MITPFSRGLGVAAATIGGGAVAAVLGLALSLFVWARPLADDFCRAALSIDPAQYAWNSYFEYSGRWAVLTLQAATLPRIRLTSWAYPAAVLALVAVWTVTLHWGIRALVARRDGSSRLWPATAMLIAVMWSGMPGGNEAFYWYTAALEYLIAVSVATGSLIALALATSQPAGVSAFRGLLGVSGALAFAAGGMHELVGICLVIILAGGSVLSYTARSVWSRFWVATFALAVAGLALSGLAPGNFAKMASLATALPAETPGVLDLLRWQFTDFLLPWAIDLRLLVLTALIVAMSQRFELKFLRDHPDQAGEWRVCLPLVTLACLCCGLLLPVVVSHSQGPGRLHDVLYEILVLGWSGSVLAWSHGRQPIAPELVPHVATASALLMAAALATAPNVSVGFRALLMADQRSVRSWASEQDAEFAATAAFVAAGGQDLVLTRHRPIPKPYYQDYYGLRPTASDWRNRCYASYFGLNSVTLALPGR